MPRARSRAFELVARGLGAPLRRRDAVRPAHAIVALGAPLTPGGRLTAILEERVVAAVELWHAGAAPLLCLAGGGSAARPEAEAMAERAAELGVPERALRIERSSRNTAENARNAARLLAAARGTEVWVVSQPFHLRRAALLFRRAGLVPLCWHVDDSIQYRQPRRALRWIGREYAALAADALLR